MVIFSLEPDPGFLGVACRLGRVPGLITAPWGSALGMLGGDRAQALDGHLGGAVTDTVLSLGPQASPWENDSVSLPTLSPFLSSFYDRTRLSSMWDADF